MNTVDITNIKRELKKRDAMAYNFETGGDLSKTDIINADTESLKKMIEDFSNEKKIKTGQEIKKIVDEIFKKFGEEGDNMIILGACNYYDEDRHISLCDDPLKKIDFNGFGHEYNKLAYPIGSDYDLEHFDHSKCKYVDGKDDDKYDELLQETNKILNLITDLELTDLDLKKYWDNDNDAINELWYGVHAITEDYKIVAFVIRNDGMLCDEDSFCSYHNHILYQI